MQEDPYWIENTILPQLEANEKIENALELAKQKNIDGGLFLKALQQLQSLNYIKMTKKEDKNLTQDVVSELGEKVLQEGTPEYQLRSKIPDQGIEEAELKALVGELFDFGIKNGQRLKIIETDKAKTKELTDAAVEANSQLPQEQQLPKKKVKKTFYVKGKDQDLDREVLQKFKNGEKLDAKDLKNLKKDRKFIIESKAFSLEVVKGDQFKPVRVALTNEISSNIIKDYQEKGASNPNYFEDLNLKPYNWNVEENDITKGNLHPLQKVKQQFKEVLLEMGFEEMPTSNYVESCFYNFDTLFVPQKHPARDLQDTFYVDANIKAKITDKEYLERVKKVHETGDYGSIGYQYNYQVEESEKLVFRTHTTAASARMLRNIALEHEKEGGKKFKPRKIYSIDRVFRNESLDQTHLAEFHQIEGIIADEEVGLGHLMGVIEKFFNKIGIKNLTFKPTYNPYTEPSLEIYGYHPKLKKLVEIGNSGVFRPEMLRPMGIPEGVQVLGWGLGLERPTMIQYGYQNIRELFGDEVKIDMVKDNGITCFQ